LIRESVGGEVCEITDTNVEMSLDNISLSSSECHRWLSKMEIECPVLIIFCRYTGCNWKVQMNFGYEFHIPKQEKVSI
jgi:hypothetical protein